MDFLTAFWPFFKWLLPYLVLQQQEDFQVVATLREILFRGLEMSLSSEDNVCLCRTNDDANVYLVNDKEDPLQVSAAVSLIANLVLQISFTAQKEGVW